MFQPRQQYDTSVPSEQPAEEPKAQQPSIKTVPVFFSAPPEQKQKKTTRRVKKNAPPQPQHEMTNDHVTELQEMSIAINEELVSEQMHPSQPQPQPSKPIKKKKQLSEKQLAHLARMRQRKSELAKQRKAQKMGSVQAPKLQNKPVQKSAPINIPQPQPEPTIEKTADYKAQKRARKRQEMKQYFEEMYAEKEKVRLANKDKRKKEKQLLYNKFVAQNASRQKPVDPNKGKKLRYQMDAYGNLQTYYE